MSDARVLIEELFREESGHLVAALVRLLGPSNVALAEDVVHDALVSAMQAWRFGAPNDPKAWLLQVAKNRAIDLLRRSRRLEPLAPEDDERRESSPIETHVETALSPEADAENQLAMMFAICDDKLSPDTHVTLILRLLCGLSPTEIARAYLCDVQTIDRRLHRGRARLAELAELRVDSADEVRRRQPSVEQALYLLFNEGYQGSDEDNPQRPAMCADALRLGELLLQSDAIERPRVHALCALFCLHSARLSTRLDDGGVFVLLAEQDRTRWNRALFERGVWHLAHAAEGDELTRFHLEAAIAFEHAQAPSLAATNWWRIVECYDALIRVAPGPVVALARALALAEVEGAERGRAELLALATDPKLVTYCHYWGARADVERRCGRLDDARNSYGRAVSLARSRAERAAYERRLRALEEKP